MSDANTPNDLTYVLETIGKLHFETQGFWARSLNVTVPQWSIVAAIRSLDSGEGTPVSEVARRERVDPSFVTAQTKLLEAQGVVVRRRSMEDGRVVLLSLSETALAGVKRIEARQSALNLYLFTDFDSAELPRLLTALQLLEKRFEKAPLVLALSE
jgi:DNA-binding MarR family transcriptional regulator